MSSPAVSVELELREAMAANGGNLGRVFVLMQEGVTSNAEIIEAGAAANSGAASNLKTTINAILSGECPTSPSLAAQAGRTIGGLIRDNNFTPEAQMYLTSFRSVLDAHSQDPEAVKREDRELELASDNLERSIEDLDGVYVYTFPTYLRTVQKTDPERYLFKIGSTERYSSIRIKEQQRATNMPEDPLTLRVYRSSLMSPEEVESHFHSMLTAAGHSRSTGKRSGREWFFTNLEFLDTLATLLKLEIHKAAEPR